MIVNKEIKGSQLTFKVEGKIDTATAPKLQSQLEDSLEGISKLVIDLSKTEYISSSGLRVLLYAQKKMDIQGSMEVCGVNDMIMEVFEITGFKDILNIK